MQLAFEDHGFKTVLISIDNIDVSNKFNVVPLFAMRITSHARFGIQTILNSDMQHWIRSKEYPDVSSHFRQKCKVSAKLEASAA